MIKFGKDIEDYKDLEDDVQYLVIEEMYDRYESNQSIYIADKEMILNEWKNPEWKEEGYAHDQHMLQDMIEGNDEDHISIRKLVIVQK